MIIFKWIKRQLDKIPGSPGLIRSGKWYVRYPEGGRSIGMTHDVAKDYKEIFGGKVWHINDKED